MGHQQRVPFVVELEWTARAVDAHFAQGIANLAAIFAAGLFDRQKRHRDRVIGFGMIGIGQLAVSFFDLGDKGLRGRNIRGGRAAVVGHVEDTVHGVATELDIFRYRDAVAAKSRHHHIHLHELHARRFNGLMIRLRIPSPVSCAAKRRRRSRAAE
jgi:hypothetical protein